MRQVGLKGLRIVRQRGDTLVEVLVAITIVATIIGGAYVVSNHSLQSNRSSQERSNALKVGEAQLEQLKSLIAQDPDKVFDAAVPTRFCLASDAAGTQVYDFTVPSQKVHCVVDASGAPTTNQPAYTIQITRSGNDFKLDETWTDVSGRFGDSLQLNYRAYQP